MSLPGKRVHLVRQQGYMLAQIAREIHAPDFAVEGAGARVAVSGDGDNNDYMRGAVHRHGEVVVAAVDYYYDYHSFRTYLIY
jgi:hypothetical protein